MKINLPQLTKKRLRWLFDHAYDISFTLAQESIPVPSLDETLLLVVKQMQRVNYEHHTDECVSLFGLFSESMSFERNSEGTTQWLAMALAIKQLCALNDEELRDEIIGCH